LQASPTDRPLDNPKAWLFTVANNLVIDASRVESHAKDVDEVTWNQIEELRVSPQISPEHALLQQERLDRLQVAVLNLTPFQRQCLHLRAEGLRYREIAEILKVSISTVVDAVRRAALKLARDLGGAEVSA
jgi:RNA polymerase sigma-70 factor (ECF subfamily)